MRNHRSIALVIPGHPFPSMKMLLGGIIFLFVLVVVSGNSWADSRDIPDFPIPLRWGMTKKEIKKVISDNNLHIAVSGGKHLGKSSFGFGEYYEWAAIKEETLKYRGYRRFIILRLNRSDRLVAISMRVIVKCCVLRFSGGDFFNFDSILKIHSFNHIGHPV